MRLAICGVKGAIAEGIVEQLDDSELPISTLLAFSENPEDSAGLRVLGRTVPVRPLAELDFSELDIALLCQPIGDVESFARDANALGCHLIDASLQWGGGRFVVPELMLEERVDYPVFWSLPHPAVSALAPVLDAVLEGNEIRSASVLICEPASALGDAGTGRLASETAKLLNGQSPDNKGSERLAFNLIPGRMPNEDAWGQCLADLLGAEFPDLTFDVLQVPLFYGETIHIKMEFEYPVDESGVTAAFASKGLHLVDNSKDFSPIAFAEDDRIHIGRIQLGRGSKNSLSLWIIADNIRKSAVVNTIKLTEILIKSYI